MKPKSFKRLNYEEQKQKCADFVRNFEDFGMEDPGANYEVWGRRKYMIMLVIFGITSATNREQRGQLLPGHARGPRDLLHEKRGEGNGQLLQDQH